MNLDHLKYICIIAEEGSISSASKKLFMSQSHLSNVIIDMENELEIQIFNRNHKGVSLTNDGKKLIKSSENIIKELAILRELHLEPKKDAYRISVYRASYIIYGLSLWIQENINKTNGIDMFYKESNLNNIIKDVDSDSVNIGIITVPTEYIGYYENILKNKSINYKEITSFNMQLIMSKKHPLAPMESISSEILNAFPEIKYGDFGSTFNEYKSINKTQAQSFFNNNIFVYDRGSMIDFLDNIPGTYIWASPIPKHLLELHNMTMKSCNDKTLEQKDILIWKNDENVETREDIFLYLQNYIESLK